MNKSLLYTITLLLVMLVTGVFWGTWFTLTRSIEVFPPDNFIRIGKTIIDNVAWPMRILRPATLWSLLGVCIAARSDKPAFYFFVTSFILMLLALIITVGVEVPIDNQIKTWTPDTLPENWTALRARWKLFHALRTFISILGFVSLTIGVVMAPRSQTAA